MSRILRPVDPEGVERLQQVCAKYFMKEHGLRVAEYNLGNAFTGNIDVLAGDEHAVYLVTINIADFAGALLRSFTGYRWFGQSRDFLRRVYPPGSIDITLPVQLVILSQEFPPEFHSIADEVCAVPIGLYRYRLFGPIHDPDIFIEEFYNPAAVRRDRDNDPDAVRTRLDIEAEHLSDDDIREFFAAMRG